MTKEDCHLIRVSRHSSSSAFIGAYATEEASSRKNELFSLARCIRPASATALEVPARITRVWPSPLKQATVARLADQFQRLELTIGGVTIQKVAQGGSF